MQTCTSKSLVKILSAASFIFGMYFSQNVMAVANEHETACMKHIQNKIAWDYDGRKGREWEPANVERLCQGTTTPNEPGECFSQAMQGHVKWGVGDKWEWQNAVSLCSGTNNAAERISCFQKRVTEGEPWSTAIFQCQSSGKIVNK